MSGEAGATLQSAWYSIFIGTGVRKIYRAETAEEEAAIERYFAGASAPYRDRLDRAKPALDALFPELVAAGIPLAPYREDRVARLDGRDRLDGSLEVLVTTSAPLSQSQIDAILNRVAAVLKGTGLERKE